MINTTRVNLEVLSQQHAQQVLDYCEQNKMYLQPWEPIRDEHYLTLANWENICKCSELAFVEQRECKFVALSKDRSEVVGLCSFTGITKGVFQACFVGYSVAEKFANKGYMTEILAAAIAYMFTEVGLNRIIATYMPVNEASGKVLEKLGFEREGFARKYLKIAGKWEDHILTAKINEFEGKKIGGF